MLTDSPARTANAGHRHSDDMIAKIDLGNGYGFTITPRSLIGSLPERMQSGLGFPVNPSVRSVTDLAQRLFRSTASAQEIDQAVASLNQVVFGDEVIEVLLYRTVEWMGESHLKAYYLLRVTYAVARHWGSFWKHALVSFMLGYLLLRSLNRAEEAVPIFEDLETTTRILTCYLGAGARSQQLTQIATHGLEEAYAKLGQPQPEPSSDSDLARRVWSLVLDYSWKGDTVEEVYVQAEAFARAAIFFSKRREHATRAVLDDLVRLAENHIASASAANQVWALPLITLTEILEENEAHEHTARLLEQAEAVDVHLSPLMLAVIANRKAATQHRLRRDDDALQTLARIALSDLKTMANSSISAQTELVLYNLARAEIAESRKDSNESKHWAKEGMRLLRSMEMWNQIPCRNREEDLRFLYVAILKQRALSRLAAFS